MTDAARLLPTLLGLFAVIGVLWLIAWKVGALKPAARRAERRGSASAEAGDEPPLRYRAKSEVLSAGERSFFPVLRAAVRMLDTGGAGSPPSGLWILTTVRLAELIEVDAVKAENPSRWQAAFNRIGAKQVDFVLCAPETTRPLLVIELDDRTHARSERRTRDAFVDDACAAAGLAILHVPAARVYDPRAIADQIRRSLMRGSLPYAAARAHLD